MKFDIANDRLMGINEICEKLGITKRTFQRMRLSESEYLKVKERPFPEPTCYLAGGKSPKWSTTEVNNWLLRKAVKDTNATNKSKPMELKQGSSNDVTEPSIDENEQDERQGALFGDD